MTQPWGASLGWAILGAFLVLLIFGLVFRNRRR